MSLDISDTAKPVEVSRLLFGENEKPHWIGMEPGGNRIVISGGNGGLESRVILAKIDPKTGKLSFDESFRSKGSEKLGVNFDRDEWPHGKTGRGIPHGAVFSRP